MQTFVALYEFGWDYKSFLSNLIYAWKILGEMVPEPVYRMVTCDMSDVKLNQVLHLIKIMIFSYESMQLWKYS